MKSKTDIIATIDLTKSYIGTFVRDKINEVECDDRFPPRELKKGDVYTISVSKYPRPVVIIKVLKDKVIGIPLTSTENVNALYKGNSRFFGESYFCNSFTVTNKEDALKRFTSVYDNSKVLNNAIKALRAFINENI